MLTDRWGHRIATSSNAARDAYVEGCDLFLAAEHGMIETLERAVAADPEFSAGHAAVARAHFSVAQVPQARAAAAKARETASGTSAREQSHVHVLALAVEGKPAEALAAATAHLRSFPRDVMVAAPATGVFGLIGFSGRQEREPEQVAYLEAIKPALDGDWWFDTVYAFALCETGQLDQALTRIEASLAKRGSNAHGAHVKAHVLYELGRDDDALAYLDRWLPAYPREGAMHCHISWHVALSALALGDTKRAWEVYERQVHPGGSWGPFLNTITDASSFLWRSEIAGAARRAERWREVRDYALRMLPKSGIAFADVHIALACVAAGDGANLDRVHAELAERIASGRYPAGGVVPALARGFAAYERSDWTECTRILEPALAETVRIGGSRAQRDLAANTLIAAYLKSDRAADARRLIAARIDRRPRAGVAGFTS